MPRAEHSEHAFFLIQNLHHGRQQTTAHLHVRSQEASVYTAECFVRSREAEWDEIQAHVVLNVTQRVRTPERDYQLRPEAFLVGLIDSGSSGRSCGGAADETVSVKLSSMSVEKKFGTIRQINKIYIFLKTRPYT